MPKQSRLHDINSVTPMFRNPGTALLNQQLAAAEYNRIIRYVRAARGVLNSAERGFLLACADRAKRKFERLRRQMAA